MKMSQIDNIIKEEVKNFDKNAQLSRGDILLEMAIKEYISDLLLKESSKNIDEFSKLKQQIQEKVTLKIKSIAKLGDKIKI